MIAQDFLAPEIQWWHLSPLIALVSGALLLLVVGALTPTWPRGGYGAATVVTAATAGVLAVFQWHAVDDDGGAGCDTLTVTATGLPELVATKVDALAADGWEVTVLVPAPETA